MSAMQNGERVEVKLHRGEADVWWAGTVVDAGRQQVRLDPGEDHLGTDTIEDESTIADWRPMRTSPDSSEV